MTTSLPCLEADHDRCTGIVIVNHLIWPCTCFCHTETKDEAAA